MEDSSKILNKGSVDTKVVQRGLPPGNASISCLFAWLGRKGDFDKTRDPSSFKGLSRYFNTWTNQGRATVAVMNFALLAGLVGLKMYYSRYKERQQAKKELFNS